MDVNPVPVPATGEPRLRDKIDQGEKKGSQEHARMCKDVQRAYYLIARRLAGPRLCIICCAAQQCNHGRPRVGGGDSTWIEADALREGF